MQVKVKLFSVGGVPASDGSIIPRRVVEEYLKSDKFKEDLAGHRLIGSLTHKVRNWNVQSKYTSAISKTAGKDDQMITVGMMASPTHYIDEVWIDDRDGWVYAKATLFDEKDMDDEAKQNIRRLKYLLSAGVMLGVSCVILGYWSSEGNNDTLQKMVALRGYDHTLNPSWKDSSVVETIGDDGEVINKIKTFSEKEVDNEFKDGDLKVKTFSDLDSLGLGTFPKSSKVDLKFTNLKAKEFSMTVSDAVVEDNVVSNNSSVVTEEKTFSVATVKERVRFAKLSPRMRFRRLFLDYKQAVKAAGGIEKIDEETLKVMKSLFATDCLDILKTITPEIQAGKPINTLIGASSLGKNVRVAAQKLMMPYKFALVEVSKRGVISPQRYKAIQAAYSEFISAMIDEVFGSSPIPEGLEEEINKEEEGK